MHTYIDNTWICRAYRDTKDKLVVASQKESNSYEEASRDSDWRDVMKNELNAFKENKTWQIVDLSMGKKKMKYKCESKVQFKVNGFVEKYKVK